MAERPFGGRSPHHRDTGEPSARPRSISVMRERALNPSPLGAGSRRYLTTAVSHSPSRRGLGGSQFVRRRRQSGFTAVRFTEAGASALELPFSRVYIPERRNIYWQMTMFGISELLTASEAAVVSQVSVRDINRVIDESILPQEFFSVRNGRHVVAVGCSLIAFYFESAKRLTSEERLWAIRHAGPRLRGDRSAATLLKEDWALQDEFLTINLEPFLRRTWERLRRLGEARNMVVSTPDILSGTPVIRGTRVPVYDVAVSLAAGIPMDRILSAYPALDADKVDLAMIYAEANPPRGRPRQSAELPANAVVITDRRLARRQKAE
jgi:uncharacterized protein (DUF433 family)